MAVEIKKFNGILDTDTPDGEVNSNSYRCKECCI